MRIGRLEINLRLLPKRKLEGWRCPVHGPINYVVNVCPKCGKGVIVEFKQE